MTAAAGPLLTALRSNPVIEVAWLYGSRATGLDTHHDSDYDIAVALIPHGLRPEERQALLEDQA